MESRRLYALTMVDTSHIICSCFCCAVPDILFGRMVDSKACTTDDAIGAIMQSRCNGYTCNGYLEVECLTLSVMAAIQCMAMHCC